MMFLVLADLVSNRGCQPMCSWNIGRFIDRQSWQYRPPDSRHPSTLARSWSLPLKFESLVQLVREHRLLRLCRPKRECWPACIPIAYYYYKKTKLTKLSCCLALRRQTSNSVHLGLSSFRRRVDCSMLACIVLYISLPKCRNWFQWTIAPSPVSLPAGQEVVFK